MPPEIPPLDLTLHIGTYKTGSTSIQQYLGANRATLLEHGYLYPRSPGRVRHLWFGMFVTPTDRLAESYDWRRSGIEEDPAEFQKRVRRRLLREVESSGRQRVLLSDEGLFSATAQGLARLRRFTDRFARSVRVVAYVRRQDDLLPSGYQQRVKVGEVRRLTEWARGDFGRYDYARRLDQWRDLLVPDALVVRRFERSAFVGESLYEDFLEAAAVVVPPGLLEPPPAERNQSLSAEAVEVLRLLNLHRVEDLGMKPWQVRNRPYVPLLQEHAAGPTLTLPEADLDRFLARWDESNRRVARDYLDDASGELFREPRKTEGTTPVQRLDPGRLDHYLELLEVPSADHAALRAIAEREARA